MRLWWNWRKRDKELEKEIQHHLQMAATERRERGASVREAESGARREFGNVGLVKEVARDVWGWRWLEDLYEDARYGLRTLRKSPGFTAIAIFTLGLGLGVNTTLFTAFNAIAMKPLPVRDSDNLFRLERWFQSGSAGSNQFAFSYPEYVSYREQNHAFSSLIAVSWPFNATAVLPASTGKQTNATAAPVPLRGQLVSANYFSTLGINAIQGRTFLDDEHDTPGAPPVVVLSFPCWQRLFHSDPGAVGIIIQLNGVALTVVGVTPREFIGTANPPQLQDFWAPLSTQTLLFPAQDWLRQPTNYEVQVLARLAPGTNASNAQAEMKILSQQFDEIHPAEDKTISIALQHATYFGETNDIRFRSFILLLMTVVGLVLLVACADLANMLLARSAGRQREIGIRLALGASRSRVVRQLLTESILLSLAGGAAGLLFSLWASDVLWVSLGQLVQLAFSVDPSIVRMSLDLPVFSYSLILSLVSAVLFGLSPALRSSSSDVTQSLKEEGSTFGQHVSRSRLRGFLIAGQVAISLTLLISTGLLVRGLLKSQTTDPGFQAQHVFPLGLQFDEDHGKANAIAARVIERLKASSLIVGIGLADRVPMAGTWSPYVQVEETRATRGDLPSQTLAARVSRGYFSALGIPIVHGRNFEALEDISGLSLVIVSERAARRFWPEEDPLGKRLKLDLDFRGNWKEFTVVGVAKDVRTANLSRIDPAFVYVATDAAYLYDEFAFVRLRDDSERSRAEIRSDVEAGTGRALPGFQLISIADGPMRGHELLPAAIAYFAIALASLTLLLVAVGIYGVVSYAVGQRTREIGVRRALGATTAEVLRLVIRQGMQPVFVGAAFGMVGAACISAVLRAILIFPGSMDLLFGVSAFDPVTFAGVAALLTLVALAACYIPARRVMRVDPVVALRYE